MKAFITFIYLFVILLSIDVHGQNQTNNSKGLIEVETIVKKSQQKYDAAKKKIYRAEEKLIHLKKIGVLSYNELTQKELLLQKAKNKLEQMRRLLEHNNTLISQTKTNPSFGKSVRSNNPITNAESKSQKKSIQDIQQEKIQKLRDQQKQALVSKVKENRNKIKQQKTKAKPKKAIAKTKKNNTSKNKKQQANN